jgi:hypothetical protein
VIVLAAFVLLDHELARDDVDLFSLVVLPLPVRQAAAALPTCLIALVDVVGDLDDAQRLLLGA